MSLWSYGCIPVLYVTLSHLPSTNTDNQISMSTLCGSVYLLYVMEGVRVLSGLGGNAMIHAKQTSLLNSKVKFGY